MGKQAPRREGQGSSYRLDWSDFDREPTNGRVVGPTWDDVRSLVEHLGRNQDTGGFIILGRGEGDYIQCARQGRGLVAEYHEPEDDEHFAAAGGPLPAEDVVALFRAWFDDPRSIADHGDWEPMEI
jgi:hypothetical protein